VLSDIKQVRIMLLSS